MERTGEGRGGREERGGEGWGGKARRGMALRGGKRCGGRAGLLVEVLELLKLITGGW